MWLKKEKNVNQSSRIEEFFQIVYDFLESGDLTKNSDFTSDGPDFLFEHDEEMEKEAPITNDLIQTGEFVDDMDGWQVWDEQASRYDVEAYNKALKRDYDEAISSYEKETGKSWKPNTRRK